MKTFIRAAEIWVPDADGYLLEFGGGVYGQAPEFGAVSRAMCFGRGEGLPGRVWEEGRPIILKDLQSGYFQRAAAAKAAQLGCALAFPVYFGDRMKAVVVLFCGSDAGPTGAIEIWRNDPRVSSDMTLQDGVYGSTGSGQSDFEAASRQTYLPRGSGLPGAAWQRQASVFIDGLSASGKFVRADYAAGAGISRGLAMPCPLIGTDNVVLALLSAPALPIASRIECWAAGSDAQSLKRLYGHDEAHGSLPLTERAASDVDPAVATALAVGLPQASGALIALPVISEGAVVEVVVMSF